MDKKQIPSELEQSPLKGRQSNETIARKNISSMSEQDIVELLFNLETHQIELQMQNDELKKVQDSLVDMRDQYTELYDFAPVGYVTLTLNGIISKSNLTFCDMLESSRSEIQDKSFAELVSKASQDSYYLFLNSIVNTAEDDNSCMLQLQSSEEDRFWVQLTGSCFQGKNDDSIQIRLVIINFNEQKQYQDLIKTLSQAVEQSPVSVVIADTKGLIEYVNHTFEQVSGFTRDEAIGENLLFLKSNLTSEAVYSEIMTTINKGKSWQGELQNLKKNGDVHWEHLHVAPVLNSQGVINHFISVSEDIMQRKLQEEKILHQAHYDSLTDLPNRFLVLDRLSQLIMNSSRKQGSVALLFLDLDDFKKVNDTLGHEIGDKLLIQAASRLRKAVRTGDSIGRLGGDEFLILLEGINEESDVTHIAENILNYFRNTFTIDGREIVVTITIGIAIYPQDGANTSELLRNADSAMYHAKETGRNSLSFFTSSMNREVSRRLVLEEELYDALRRNEFYVCYQPLIDIKARKTCGFEALLRWQSQKLGLIMPIDFISIAEQTGHIIPIGQFVIKQAVSSLARWQKAYQADLHMTVNLSYYQFRDSELLTIIEEVIQREAILNGSLKMDFTEGGLLNSNPVVDEAFKALKQLDIGLNMDDFGTGYSSLTRLRLYPFDTLKIDHSFVKDMCVDQEDKELVNAAITMAHSLGLKVIAEGVETREQLALLTELGCDIAQGYLFSKPVTEDKIEAFLKSEEAGSFIEKQFINE